ncbi:MarR family transcriptional regulator [Streptomyces sp. NPDC001401]|uniref:MarR family transcriptional regulator n=1 Tax=Streptomyces sp. NPDC001401 TaxID=3364570 RepID=UPI0036C78B89
MNVTDLTCFAYAIEAGENLLTTGGLAARAHITTGAVTGTLNRLERASYVTRRPDPADRHQVRVAALSDAEARACEVYEPYYARLNTLKETAMKPLLPSRTSTTMDDLTEEHLHENDLAPLLAARDLAHPVLADPERRHLLNEIAHPRTTQAFHRLAAAA